MRNEQDIVVGSKGGLKTKFETKYHFFSSYVFYFVPLLLKFREHLELSVLRFNGIKNVQFGFETRENLKVFDDRIFNNNF
jgi:hypothetical protein